MSMEHLATRFTIGIDGSFGVLNYAFLAFAAAASDATGIGLERQDEPHDSLTADLLLRGFRVACNADFPDIALKAQPADGSIQCRVSAAGLISLVVDDTLVWSRRYDPTETDTALCGKLRMPRKSLSSAAIISGLLTAELIRHSRPGGGRW